MGSNMARRLKDQGYQIAAVYDASTLLPPNRLPQNWAAKPAPS